MADFIAHDARIVAGQVAALIENFPELADDEELRITALEGETDLHSVMSRLVRFSKERQAEAKGIDGYIEELAERKARKVKAADGAREIMRSLMQTGGIDKLALPEATISLTKPRANVDILDPDVLPQGYFKTVRQADKDAIKKSLLAGEAIPGAALVHGTPSITVRVK